MDKQNNEKTSFWGRPVKDEKGHVVAYKDEFGDVRTKKEIVNEGVGCLFVGLSVLALLGCVFARGCQEIKRRLPYSFNSYGTYQFRYFFQRSS